MSNKVDVNVNAMENSKPYSRSYKWTKWRKRAEKYVQQRMESDRRQAEISQKLIAGRSSARKRHHSDSSSSSDHVEFNCLQSSSSLTGSDIEVAHMDEIVVEPPNLQEVVDDSNSEGGSLLSSVDAGSSHSDASNSGSENDEQDLPLWQNDAERDQYVAQTLCDWVLDGGVLSMSKVDDLLHRLRPVHPNLPKSHKTLLHTPNRVDVVDWGNAQFWYRGIKSNLDAFELEEYLQTTKCVEIDVNMDGLPVFRKSKKKFWPILGRLVGAKNEPFVIAIYYGSSDPENIDQLLDDYINEVENLSVYGYIHNNVRYDFSIRHYILDAPARSLVKCCINHTGYASCEKCTVWGETHSNRRTYTDLNAPLRTDASYVNQEQPHHHNGISPLLRLGTQMVSQFRLESMHLVYEGVFKRLLTAWLEWRGNYRLHWTVKEEMSNAFCELAPSCPLDFNRKPRGLSDFAFFKATEFRRILLYDGVVVFSILFDDNLYKNFLLLHSAAYILACPEYCHLYNDLADKLLRAFINHSVDIYGKAFVSYNVHALCHLAQECAEHGPLESFSAFTYENKLKSIKSLLRSGYRPLQQVARREMEQCKAKPVHLDSGDNDVLLSRCHSDPNEGLAGRQYKRVTVNGVIIQINERDNCVRTINGRILLVKNILHRNDNSVLLVGYAFSTYADVYTYPLNSSQLGIVRLSDLEISRTSVPLTSVAAKCWLMPDRDGSFVCIPLVHSVPFVK